MTWILVILLLLLLLLLWLLLSPLQIEIDSRQPVAILRWYSIGKAAIWYEEEWRLRFRVLFFQKSLRLATMKAGPKPDSRKIRHKKEKKQRPARKRMLKRMIRVLRSFRVLQWNWALDTGDHTLNAQLYPLNFAPRLYQHLQVNFTGENYLYLKIRNSGWRMLWAFLR